MMHPKVIGDRTLAAVVLGLEVSGFTVLLPIGENCRYDLIADDGSRVLRVQCKTGRLRQGAVRFAACSTYAHHLRPRTTRRDYHGQNDCFAVYCPETGGVYLIPIAELAVKVQAALRVDPVQNGQAKGIRYADDYEVARVTSAAARRSRPVRLPLLDQAGSTEAPGANADG